MHAGCLLAFFVLDEWTFRRALSKRGSGCLETRPLWDSAQLPNKEQSLVLMCRKEWNSVQEKCRD